ncbi:MAG TPA: hypothetical protein VN655_15580 [Pseudolabrys sp.]|nr:hypothetical protein [Pseudolabrys sp.]
MNSRAAAVAAASVIFIAVVLAGCSSQPVSIVGDDAALCDYSAQANGASSLARCRDRLDRRQRRLTAATATRIDGYALLNTPDQPPAVAGRCKTPDAPKDCDPGDVTGTIPAAPKR